MCQVCSHNQIKNIDRFLLTGASAAAVGKKYGFSTAAVQRHQQHLTRKMAQAEQRFHASLHQGLLCKLNIVLELVLGVVRSAQAGGDFKLFLQATREVSRIINLMLKMDVRLDPEMIYCLVTSPQWDLQDSLLPDAFTSLVQTRETLKTNLFADCPDPEPELEPVPAAPLETREPELDTPTPQPAAPPETRVGHRPPVAGHDPRPKREKSAKLPRKSAPSNDNSKEYQADNLYEKNSPEKRETLWEKFRRKWEKSGKLPGKTPSSGDVNQVYQ